jgi:hypothetical protein
MTKILILFVALTILFGVTSPGSRPRWGDNDLQKMFDVYNDSYFNGKLPATPVYWADIPKDGDDYILGNTYEELTAKTYTIYIDRKSNVASITWMLTELHEMCHVATMQAELDAGETEHGPRFQKCMQRLAENGAFDNLW